LQKQLLLFSFLLLFAFFFGPLLFFVQNFEHSTTKKKAMKRKRGAASNSLSSIMHGKYVQLSPKKQEEQEQEEEEKATKKAKLQFDDVDCISVETERIEAKQENDAIMNDIRSEANAEQIKTEEVKTEQIKTEEVKTEQIKTEEVKTEQIKAKLDFDPMQPGEIPPSAYHVDSSLTDAFRQTLPHWRLFGSELDTRSFRHRGKLQAFVKQIVYRLEKLWLFLVTPQDETVAVCVRYSPSFYVPCLEERGEFGELLQCDQYHELFWDYKHLHRIADYLLDGPLDQLWTPSYVQNLRLRDKWNSFANSDADALNNSKGYPVRGNRGGYVITDVALEYKLPADGYRGEIKRPHLKITCNSEEARQYFMRTFLAKKLPQQQDLFLPYVYQQETSLQQQFMNERRVHMFAFVELQNYTVVTDFHERATDTQRVMYEVRCNATDIHTPNHQMSDTDIMKHFRTCYLDIETINGKTRFGVPLAIRADDLIVACSVYGSTFADPGDYDRHPNYYLALGKTHSTVADLLNDLWYLLGQYDVVEDYNGMSYDFPYCLAQAYLYGKDCDFNRLSAFKGHRLFTERDYDRWLEIGSNQAARNFLIPGLIHLDILKMIKKNDLEVKGSKKLKNAAPQLLKHYKNMRGQGTEIKAADDLKKKIDLPYEMIRPTWLLDPQKLEDYNRRDSILLPQISDAQSAHLFFVLICKLTLLENDYEYLVKGQQIKLWNLIVQHVYNNGWLISRERIRQMARSEQFQCGYKGGCVLKAKKGLHYAVLIFDFESLYPSIMMSNRICYSTLITALRYLRIAILRGRPMQEIPIAPGVKPVFVQGAPAILCEILHILIRQRKKFKDERDKCKKTGDLSGYTLNEQRQKVAKVIANSGYGFAGVKLKETPEEAQESKQRHKERMLKQVAGQNAFQKMTSAQHEDREEEVAEKKRKIESYAYLPCPIIAKAVTARGREMLSRVSGLLTSKYKAEIIYGDTDSIMVQFPIAVPPGVNLQADTEQAVQIKKQFFEMGERAAADATAMFEDPVRLQVENFCLRGVWVKKKCYAFLACGGLAKPWEYKDKGLFTVRGDWCQLSRTLGDRILKGVVRDGESIERAGNLVFETVDRMRKGEVQLKEYVVSKRVGDLSKYKDARKIAQANVARKIAEREPMRKPDVGDFVDMVQIVVPPGTLKSEAAEDAEYVKQHPKECAVDVKYYFRDQMKNPISNILNALSADSGKRIMSLAEARLHGNRSLQSMWSRKEGV
jgi:DNA polymerase elongation subunit (family B)